MTARLRVPPTRSVLLRLRRQRHTLLGAADLLERKRQVLAQKALDLLPRWEEAQRGAYPLLARAYRSFVVTRMRSTRAELRPLVAGGGPMLAVRVRRQVLSGVPTFEAATEPAALKPRFGLLGSTAELDRTLVLLRDATEALARLAAMQATLRSLAGVLRKTNRQVRVLRDRLIPQHEATIRYVEETLEEQERDYLFGLRRITSP